MKFWFCTAAALLSVPGLAFAQTKSWRATAASAAKKCNVNFRIVGPAGAVELDPEATPQQQSCFAAKVPMKWVVSPVNDPALPKKKN